MRTGDTLKSPASHHAPLSPDESHPPSSPHIYSSPSPVHQGITTTSTTSTTTLHAHQGEASPPSPPDRNTQPASPAAQQSPHTPSSPFTPYHPPTTKASQVIKKVPLAQSAPPSSTSSTTSSPQQQPQQQQVPPMRSPRDSCKLISIAQRKSMLQSAETDSPTRPTILPLSPSSDSLNGPLMSPPSKSDFYISHSSDSARNQDIEGKNQNFLFYPLFPPPKHLL